VVIARYLLPSTEIAAPLEASIGMTVAFELVSPGAFLTDNELTASVSLAVSIIPKRPFRIPKRVLIWIHGYAGERKSVID